MFRLFALFLMIVYASNANAQVYRKDPTMYLVKNSFTKSCGKVDTTVLMEYLVVTTDVLKTPDIVFYIPRVNGLFIEEVGEDPCNINFESSQDIKNTKARLLKIYQATIQDKGLVVTDILIQKMYASNAIRK